MKNKLLKYRVGDVIRHRSHQDTVGLVIETMDAWRPPESVHFKRHLSGVQYQVYWTVCPAGDTDLQECWYPEEHISKINEKV